jgi:predicted O-methyltransferase YrrM
MSNLLRSRENLRTVLKCFLQPRLTFRLARKGFLSKDRVYFSQSGWNFGNLARVPVAKLFPKAAELEVNVIRAWDRTWMTSVSVEELCVLLAIAKCVNARKILEIGTWDGNTTLNLAANTDSIVTTVDLPPEFDVQNQRNTLAHPEAELNVTNRSVLGRQFKNHPFNNRIHQVFGDSAQLDWSTLGGPFDLILIDGCHDYAYVKSDTENAIAQLGRGGVILWHDYGMIDDVCRVVDSLETAPRKLRVYALEGTRFAIGMKDPTEMAASGKTA